MGFFLTFFFWTVVALRERWRGFFGVEAVSAHCRNTKQPQATDGYLIHYENLPDVKSLQMMCEMSGLSEHMCESTGSCVSLRADTNTTTMLSNIHIIYTTSVFHRGQEKG